MISIYSIYQKRINIGARLVNCLFALHQKNISHVGMFPRSNQYYAEDVSHSRTQYTASCKPLLVYQVEYSTTALQGQRLITIIVYTCILQA